MLIFGKERDYVVHDDKNIKGMFGPYRYMSNFHIAPVVYEGIEYPSTENVYQAYKSTDHEIRKQFINITPSESKKLGRSIVVRDDWENIKFDLMYEICKYKFTKH